MVLLNRRKYIHRRRPQGAPADLADAVVTLASETVTYTGNPVYPSVAVTYEGATLVVNTDYTLNYSDNTEVGAATVVVTGMGEFAGQVVKTFQIVAASTGSWADFDLSNLGFNSEVDSVQLKDRNAVYAATRPLDPYTLQLLSDGRLHFGSQLQGHAYIWGFDEGHEFEVSHLKSTYDSRSSVVDYMGSELLTPDGTAGVYSHLGEKIVRFSLSTAFNLSTRSIVSTENFGNRYAMHMAFSSDGTKFFHKRDRRSDGNYELLYCRPLTTPYDVAAFNESDVTSVSLNTVAAPSSGNSWGWCGFCFSPDGRFMVATSGPGQCEVHKFALSTPWDISTMERVSHAAIIASSVSYPNAVAVNNSGTKMIVAFRDVNDSAYCKFYEYNLTA